MRIRRDRRTSKPVNDVTITELGQKQARDLLCLRADDEKQDLNLLQETRGFFCYDCSMMFKEISVQPNAQVITYFNKPDDSTVEGADRSGGVNYRLVRF